MRMAQTWLPIPRHFLSQSQAPTDRLAGELQEKQIYSRYGNRRALITLRLDLPIYPSASFDKSYRKASSFKLQGSALQHTVRHDSGLPPSNNGGPRRPPKLKQPQQQRPSRRGSNSDKRSCRLTHSSLSQSDIIPSSAMQYRH